MGVEQSKLMPRNNRASRASFQRRPTYKVVEGVVEFSNGDRYVGDTRDGKLHGNGYYYYRNGDLYKGDWCNNRKEGYGIQIYANDNTKYVGHWKDNLPQGEGTVYYSDGSYYTGYYLEGERHGKGIYHDAQNDDYEEEWSCGEQVRRAPLSPFRKESTLTNFTGDKGNKENIEDGNDSPKYPESEGDKKSESENDFSEKRKPKGIDEERLHSNILFKSRDLDSIDGKAYEVGVDTLNIIEHMDMLNSVAGVLLNKDVREWTYKDVGDWLRHLGLDDYIEKFHENHIDGKILFEINEGDLKDDFGMTSVGHRKNFVKALDNLKRIYAGESGKNTDYIRQKIQKFYEKNRSNHSRPLINSFRGREGRFFSNRFFSRNAYNSQHEVIDEDEELSPQSEASPSPPRSIRKGFTEDEPKGAKEHTNKSPMLKKKKEDWDADDECRSLDLDDEKPKEIPSKTHLSKKTLSRLSSENEKNSTGQEDQEKIKQDYVNTIEDFKNDSPRKIERSSSKSDGGSSSDTSTDSEPSDDEKKKIVDEKLKEGPSVLEVPGLRIGKSQSKQDKRTTKKHLSSNFKSLELPSSSRQGVMKGLGDRKKKHKQPNDKQTLNKKIKEEILRIFKDSGLNENFIIDYNDITFEKKIGEGGYGRVFLGKFSGTDVAIKEYGKTKLDVRRAEDFVKEVEVISNLRHPNIVLCMGACIHDGKYLMITEYLEEGSLFDHLHKNHTKINDDTMFNIIEDIALGMCYLHGRRVFHCDLKSSNILIDSNWSVKLCDFGLSRVKYKSDRKRFQKQRVGTPHWMAPEILRGEKYDEAADVYSFGMVLWELMTGEIPYVKMPISDIIATVGHEGKQITLPSKGNPHILAIMNKCLSLKKEERPTFKQVVNQLQQRTKSLLGIKKNKTWF